MLDLGEQEKVMKRLIFLLMMMIGISGVALADGHLAGEEDHDMGDHASTMQDGEPEMSGDDQEDPEPEDPEPEDPEPEAEE